MKKLIFMSSLLISFQLHALEEVWKIGSSFVPMFKNESLGTLLSLHCETKKCDASEMLKTISMSLLKKNDLAGGKNPGAVLCQKLPDAAVLFMVDLQGNQNSFCKFKDGSMASTSTLVIYAEKNQKR